MAAPPFDQARLQDMSRGRERLMTVLCRRIDDGMLDEIAACDYGVDQAEHFAALKQIRARDLTPDRPLVRMAWVPKEVLELFRWSEFGDDRSNRRQRSEGEFHLMRAFCCAALLEAYVVPENAGYFDGTNATVVQLLESIEALGTEAEAETPAFIAGMLTRLASHEPERAFYIVALVWALIRDGVSTADRKLIADLIDWAIAEEAAVREMWHGGVGMQPGRWLIGTTHFDLRWKKWEAIGRRLGDEAASIEDAGFRSKLDDLSTRLTDDWT